MLQINLDGHFGTKVNTAKTQKLYSKGERHYYSLSFGYHGDVDAWVNICHLEMFMIGRRFHEFILYSKERILYLVYNHILVMWS